MKKEVRWFSDSLLSLVFSFPPSSLHSTSERDKFSDYFLILSNPSNTRMQHSLPHMEELLSAIENIVKEALALCKDEGGNEDIQIILSPQNSLPSNCLTAKSPHEGSKSNISHISWSATNPNLHSPLSRSWSRFMFPEC